MSTQLKAKVLAVPNSFCSAQVRVLVGAASCLCDQRLKFSIVSIIYKTINFNLNKVVVAGNQNET